MARKQLCRDGTPGTSTKVHQFELNGKGLQWDIGWKITSAGLSLIIQHDVDLTFMLMLLLDWIIQQPTVPKKTASCVSNHEHGNIISPLMHNKEKRKGLAIPMVYNSLLSEGGLCFNPSCAGSTAFKTSGLAAEMNSSCHLLCCYLHYHLTATEGKQSTIYILATQ